ncbi:hypothetical protein BE21_55310 [Sorangium cellulosum]|uniref:Uncharacterized protein n=1 Tax=Sorangium cellulosum TaxID=56 RepID=A0A150TBY6_SORCE|nr:hypothetical protein BE21_55310 [Sorangium cellulosum]
MRDGVREAGQRWAWLAGIAAMAALAWYSGGRLSPKLQAMAPTFGAIQPRSDATGDEGRPGADLHELAMREAQQGRVDEARTLYERSLELKRRAGDVQGEAPTLHELAVLDAQQGRVDEARALYERALELKRRVGDVQGEAPTLHQIAVLDADQGRVDEARALYERALELERRACRGRRRRCTRSRICKGSRGAWTRRARCTTGRWS